MRKNIFEILQNIDVAHKIRAIWFLFTRSKIFIPRYSIYHPNKDEKSILECVGLYSFTYWKSRYQFISPQDMMNHLGINEKLIMSISEFSNEVINVLEFIANMIKRCDNAISQKHLTVSDEYIKLKENINIFIEEFGYMAHYYEDEARVEIIEKNPAAISVAEISEPEIAKRIIQYNHYMLKGNIDAKKDIIITLANNIEPLDKELSTINHSFTSDLFCMLNNMNIRHNNIDPNDAKQFKPFVAKMSKNELELWYDEIYQMILLAKLLLDNKERQERIKELKSNF